MEELNLTEKEILKELLAKLDMLFRLKYGDDREQALDREIELCKMSLSSFNQVNISELEEKYKR